MVRKGREHLYRDGIGKRLHGVCECREKVRSKISTMVVGLDFYTTSSSFLESFLSVMW